MASDLPRLPMARRRLAQGAMSALSVGLFVFMFTAPHGEVTIDPGPLCTEQQPCAPEPWLYISLGALVSTLLVGWISPWTAALAASVFAALSAAFEDPGARAISEMLAFAGAMWLLAWIAESHRPKASATWTASTTAHVPATTSSRRPGATAWRNLLVVGTATLAGTGIWLQYQADARAQQAEIVPARVSSYVDDYRKLRLVLPGGGRADVPARLVFDYPVGSTVNIRADAKGLTQLVAEPADNTGWFLPAALLACFGLAVQLHRRRRATAWKSFISNAQPATNVWYAWSSDAIYPIGAQPGDPPLARLTDVQWLERAGSGMSAGFWQSPVRAIIYGHPARRAPVALAPDNLPLLAVATLAPTGDGPGFEAPSNSPDDALSEPADVTYEVRWSNSQVYLRAFILPGIGAGQIVSLIGPATHLTALAFSAPIAAALLLLVWRSVARPALLWNAGGVAVAGFLRTSRLRWSEVVAIRSSRWGGLRLVTIGGRQISATTGDNHGIAAAIQAAEDLSERLEAARRRYNPAVEPPVVTSRPDLWRVLSAAFVVATIVGTFWPR